MRAGSDIGYCDSDYPKAPFEWCEQDIKANVEALGFKLEEVILGDYKMRLYLIDKNTDLAYDFEDLEYDIYETYTRKDFLTEYTKKWYKEDLEI